MDTLYNLIVNIEKVKNKGWIKAANKDNSGIGITLEHELGINSGDLEIPDYDGIEIKAKKVNSEPYINLFSAAPDSYLYEIKRIHEQYGYSHSKYPEFKVFNTAISGNRFTSIGNKYLFILNVDYEKKQVVLHVHDKYSKYLIDDKSAWSFDMLEEKLYRKLKYMMLVKAERSYKYPNVYYRYISNTLYILKDFKTFLKAIDNGTIIINFKINVFKTGPKKGQIHDHGTSFEIKDEDLEKIFYKI